MRSSSQTFSKHLSSVSTNTCVVTNNTIYFRVEPHHNNCEINCMTKKTLPGLSLECRVRSLRSPHRIQSTVSHSVCRSACCLIRLSACVYIRAFVMLSCIQYAILSKTVYDSYIPPSRKLQTFSSRFDTRWNVSLMICCSVSSLWMRKCKHLH